MSVCVKWKGVSVKLLAELGNIYSEWKLFEIFSSCITISTWAVENLYQSTSDQSWAILSPTLRHVQLSFPLVSVMSSIHSIRYSLHSATCLLTPSIERIVLLVVEVIPLLVFSVSAKEHRKLFWMFSHRPMCTTEHPVLLQSGLGSWRR